MAWEVNVEGFFFALAAFEIEFFLIDSQKKKVILN